MHNYLVVFFFEIIQTDLFSFSCDQTSIATSGAGSKFPGFRQGSPGPVQFTSILDQSFHLDKPKRVLPLGVENYLLPYLQIHPFSKNDICFPIRFSARSQFHNKSAIIVLFFLGFDFSFCFSGNLENINWSLRYWRTVHGVKKKWKYQPSTKFRISCSHCSLGHFSHTYIQITLGYLITLLYCYPSSPFWMLKL